jgi:hypothetical protein
MEPDYNVILSAVGLGILFLGGFVKIMARLQKIENRLEMDDKGKPERDHARRLEMADIARGVCQVECRRETATNPGLPRYTGDIVP